MGNMPAFVLIRQVANKAVSPDRRGRAVLEVFWFLTIKDNSNFIKSIIPGGIYLRKKMKDWLEWTIY
jgi:hypothetical protein